jgi:transposase InsO family protein
MTDRQALLDEHQRLLDRYYAKTITKAESDRLGAIRLELGGEEIPPEESGADKIQRLLAELGFRYE